MANLHYDVISEYLPHQSMLCKELCQTYHIHCHLQNTSPPHPPVGVPTIWNKFRVLLVKPDYVPNRTMARLAELLFACVPLLPRNRVRQSIKCIVRRENRSSSTKPCQPVQCICAWDEVHPVVVCMFLQCSTNKARQSSCSWPCLQQRQGQLHL